MAEQKQVQTIKLFLLYRRKPQSYFEFAYAASEDQA